MEAGERSGSIESTVIPIVVAVATLALVLFLVNLAKPMSLTDWVYFGGSILVVTLLTTALYFVLPRLGAMRCLSEENGDGENTSC